MGRMSPKSSWHWQGEEQKAGHAFIARRGGPHRGESVMWLASLLENKQASEK